MFRGAAVQQSDGKLVITTGYDDTAVRLLASGQLDTSFGHAGTIAFSGGDPLAEAVQADDKIVIGGGFTTVDDGSGPVTRNCLVRLNANGQVDPTFDIGAGFSPGEFDAPGFAIPYGGQGINQLAVDSAGRILAIGHLVQYDTIGCNDFVRLLPDGSFDPSFIAPPNLDLTNFAMSSDGLTFYAGSTLQRYFYGATSNVAPASFGIWQSANSMSGTAAAMPMKDGVPNLLKYLFHVDPTRPMTASDRAALPTIGTSQIGAVSYMTLTYRVNQAMMGVTVNAQTSSDLQSWNGTAPVVPMGTDPQHRGPNHAGAVAFDGRHKVHSPQRHRAVSRKLTRFPARRAGPSAACPPCRA